MREQRSQVDYWQKQEQRWHEKYIELEGLADKLETKIWDLERALREIAEINNKRDRFSSEIDAIIVKALGGAND